MHRSLFAFLLALLLAGSLAPTASVQAAAASNDLLFNITCDGFDSRGGSITLDRDNTGTGREQFIITATDGLGNVIFNPTAEDFLVGTRLAFPLGLEFTWTSAPQANPLTLHIYSPAGNGLLEQSLYVKRETCDSLTTPVAGNPFILSPEALAFFGQGSVNPLSFDFLNYTGVTSPSTPINANPARPGSSDPDLINSLPGYLIVTAGALNLRSGDSAAYTVVGRVDINATLAVVGRNEDRSWWYVDVNGIVGWVNAEEVVIRGDLTNVPLVTVAGELERPRLAVFFTQPLRTIPVEGALTLCDVQQNVEYFIVGRNADATWYELAATCNGANVTGWLPAEAGGFRSGGGVSIPITD